MYQNGEDCEQCEVTVASTDPSATRLKPWRTVWFARGSWGIELSVVMGIIFNPTTVGNSHSVNEIWYLSFFYDVSRKLL